MKKRLLEIDAVRGIAILGMIFFHGAYAALLLGFLDFEPYGWPLIIPVRVLQFLFLGLMGLSVHLSSRGFLGQARRAGGIAAAAVAVSIGTYLIFPDSFVKFGVLHFAAAAILITMGFKGRSNWALPMAFGSFILGEVLSQITVSGTWLFPFGLIYPGFSSLDYFPLFPWLSMPLIGLWIGEHFYPNLKPTWLAIFGKVPGLCFMGRHSLAIYLLHPPILYFSLLWLS